MSDSSSTVVPRAGETRRLPVPPAIVPDRQLSPGQWGMIAFLCSEVALFSTLIVSYLIFVGRDSQPGGLGGPTPAEVLSLPLVLATTFCLLSSSVTVHLAEPALRQGLGSTFVQLWMATIALGVVFLLGTAHEWSELIYRHRLTISRNLFGTTFYTLVGFHALHVTMGVLIMLLVLVLAWRGYLTPPPETHAPERHGAAGKEHHAGVELVSWYWHFVDAVWLVVFTVVYLIPLAG